MCNIYRQELVHTKLSLKNGLEDFDPATNKRLRSISKN